MTVRVQEAPFDAGAETAALTASRTDIGGIASFVGLVRGEGDAVRALTLEHYPGMTERRLAEIEAEARSRWELLDCLIIHRVGRMLPGEPIVLVLCASAHRGDAFAACQFLMDWLKTDAPFWKQEETPDGTRWVDAKESDDAAAAKWK
ncbi:molybdenum cofactor biosynthesis protein MoaE [Radicibacter daui]|uniref:molybdenum cofactor biosynthesis protein MoaE n=1 Tax=Radicibacter daui TaxID=3064829 RepID=UPI004046CBE6